MPKQSILFWMSVFGGLAAIAALVVFVTGRPSLPAFFQSNPVSAEHAGMGDYTVSLDMLNLSEVQVFPLQTPLPFGANDQFLGDHILVVKYGDHKGAFVLQCRTDRQCRKTQLSDLMMITPAHSFFFDNQLYVTGEESVGSATTTNTGGVAFNTRLTQPEASRVWVYHFDLLRRTNSYDIIYSGGCWLHGLHSDVDAITPGESDQIEVKITSWCDTVMFGEKQARAPNLRNHPELIANYVAAGSFGAEGQFRATSLSVATRVDR